MRRILILLAVLAGGAGPVYAQVVRDGTSAVTGTNTAATTLTITGKTSAGSNRVGVVSCAWNSETPTITGATWAGVAMTILDQGAEVTNGSLGAGMLWVAAPPTTSSSVVVTWDSGSTAQCVASSYSGAHQSTPTNAIHKTITTGAVATPVTNTVTTASDEFVVDAVSFTQFDGSETFTVGTGQTQLLNATYATFYKALSSDQAGSVDGVMTWGFTGGGLGSYVSVASSLKPAAGGGGGGGSTCNGGLLLRGVGCH